MNEEILLREESFHDEWAKDTPPHAVNVDALEKACTMPETRYIIKTMGKDNFKDKKILDVGCGCGEASVYFAKQGACVTASDISSGMVDLAVKVAEYHNVKIDSVVCSAEELPFEDNSFDIVYAANVLHHVDIKKALSEIKRVLKKDGIFIAWDPLKYNPAIKLYRRLANGVRTVDEHPLDIEYLRQVKNNFNDVTNKGFWFLTNLIFVKYFFINRLNPSKVRYWKKVVDDADNIKNLYIPLEKIDKFLLKVFPFLKWLCWNMVVMGRKG